jgi:hypothetical protein
MVIVIITVDGIMTSEVLNPGTPLFSAGGWSCRDRIGD